VLQLSPGCGLAPGLESGGARSPIALAVPAVQAAGVDMEEEFLNLGLDIIGLGVFNYDFGSITTESPVIQAVYGLLKEAEHRSTFYIPYWDLPLARCAAVLDTHATGSKASRLH